jgi:hypothetical protein
MRRKGRHIPALGLLAVSALVWTWPLALHWRDHVPGPAGDNFSFLWNLWWMRRALSVPELSYFQSTYLFSPFGVDLVNHPHTALQGLISATMFSSLSVIEAENLYIIVSVFLNAVCAYALAFDITRQRRLSLLAAVAFGGSPYIAAHLFGHFDLLTAWVVPLFALFLRRALEGGGRMAALGSGLCVAIAAYTAYYHVVYLAIFALAYTIAYWHCCHLHVDRRPNSSAGFTLPLVIVGLIALDLAVIVWIAMTGGSALNAAGLEISARGLQNPLFALWLLVLGWLMTRWRLRVQWRRPPSETFWRGIQALMITAATFAVLCMPLIVQAFRLLISGRYVSQVYFWRSAPRGIDALAPVMGNPFHPLLGGAVSSVYRTLGLDRIEAVAWIGLVPLGVLLTGRGRWFDGEEARRWKVVLAVFAIFALGPFLTLAGYDLGLPLPQALARFVPLMENARMPGRAMVCVYLALGILMALRLGIVDRPSSIVHRLDDDRRSTMADGRSTMADRRSTIHWSLIALLALDYLHAPIPLTALDRPAVYEHLGSIDDDGAVIELPFGIGDGLSPGVGDQNRRILYYATIHGHPVIGGYIGRMPPGVAEAYQTMPVVGNLLRLSSGGDAVQEESMAGLPFRYLVLDTRTASPDLIDYVKSTLDLDLIASGDGKELYAVQGVKPPNLRAANEGSNPRRYDKQKTGSDLSEMRSSSREPIGDIEVEGSFDIVLQNDMEGVVGSAVETEMVLLLQLPVLVPHSVSLGQEELLGAGSAQALRSFFDDDGGLDRVADTTRDDKRPFVDR